MKIAIVGTGYVGLVTGACLVEFGHQAAPLFCHSGRQLAGIQGSKCMDAR